MMKGFERVPIDFSVDGGVAAINQIEGILSTGHWSERALNLEDERSMLLLRLLRFGDIEIHKREYERAIETPELRQKVTEMNWQINKRSLTGILLDIADIFGGYEYDIQKTDFNSLFFPELKAFVRCGGLPANRLIGLLENEGCETVFLFPGDYCEQVNVYFAFTLGVSKKRFLDEVKKTNDRIFDIMCEISRRFEEMHGDIIPAVDYGDTKKKP